MEPRLFPIRPSGSTGAGILEPALEYLRTFSDIDRKDRFNADLGQSLEPVNRPRSRLKSIFGKVRPEKRIYLRIAERAVGINVGEADLIVEVGGGLIKVKRLDVANVDMPSL